MKSFAEIFSDFLSKLKNNILEEISESSPVYERLKAENNQRLIQLKSSAPLPLLDDYIEILYAIAFYEANYCYLCGMRDSKLPNKINPTDESILRELHKNEKYAQLKSGAIEFYSELQSVLTPECCAVLTQYIEAWNTITELEKHYCYSGGVFDKSQMDKQLDPANTAEWTSRNGIFL